MKWAVLVSDPVCEETLKVLLEEVGQEPDTFTQDGIKYFIHSKHTCILEATLDAKTLKNLGWRNVKVVPI